MTGKFGDGFAAWAITLSHREICDMSDRNRTIPRGDRAVRQIYGSTQQCMLVHGNEMVMHGSDTVMRGSDTVMHVPYSGRRERDVYETRGTQQS